LDNEGRFSGAPGDVNAEESVAAAGRAAPASVGGRACLTAGNGSAGSQAGWRASRPADDQWGRLVQAGRQRAGLRAALLGLEL